MFARNVALRLRPNSLNEFKRILDSQIIPLLHKQPGFTDLIAFAPVGGTDMTVISLWETREHAEAYHTATYARVMKSFEPLLDASPKLRTAEIVSSTFHKLADSTAA
jgi:heme-degrading monooxygenase HmoA